MVPHPRAVDNNAAAAVIIHAPSGNSKQGEIDDLVIAQCMAQRKVTSAMTMPLKYRMPRPGRRRKSPR
jgi:hypothetical protein